MPRKHHLETSSSQGRVPDFERSLMHLDKFFGDSQAKARPAKLTIHASFPLAKSFKDRLAQLWLDPWARVIDGDAYFRGRGLEFGVNRAAIRNEFKGCLLYTSDA